MPTIAPTILDAMDESDDGILIPGETLIRLPRLGTVGPAKDHPYARPSGAVEDAVRVETLSGGLFVLAWNTWVGQDSGLARERVQCLAGGPCPIVHSSRRGGGVTALRSHGQWNNVAIAKRVVTAASVLPTVTHGVVDVVRRVVKDGAGMQDLVFVPVPILVVFGGKDRPHGIFVYSQER